MIDIYVINVGYRLLNYNVFVLNIIAKCQDTEIKDITLKIFLKVTVYKISMNTDPRTSVC